MEVMVRRLKFLVFTSIVISGVVLFAGLAPVAQAQAADTVFFYIDSGFDRTSRTRVSGSLRYEGTHAQFYVEDVYWNGLSSSSRAVTASNLADMSDSFDSVIYPEVTGVFGTEWNPGIDNNPKITVLITQMKDNIGGYFREEDELKRSQIANSNEREMLYLNTDFLGSTRNMKAFLAHELQHLIHYNQKSRLRNVREEVWVNEMMSEVASSIAGLNDIYRGSNLQSRVSTFLDSPGDDMTRWNNQKEDYGVASMFGHYLLGKYGEGFFTALSQSSEKEFEAINEALDAVGADVRFEDVFNNWVTASLVNNCAVGPARTFCYLYQNLGYDNLHITFNTGAEGGSRISQTDASFPWQGNWYSYSTNIEPTRPDDHIFVFTLNKAQGANFSVPYVVYPVSGLPQVFYMNFNGNTGKFYFEDFGYKYDQVVVMPVFQNFTGTAPLTNYSLTAEITTTIPPDATKSIIATDTAPLNLPDGSLVREENSDKVYIIKDASGGGKYKRWIQAPEIIDMYGHLSWDNVIVVASGALGGYEEVSVIRFIGDPRVYVVSASGEKSWIETEQEFLGLGYTFDMVYEVNEREFNFYKTI